jgi:hypothetical protein
MVDDPFQLVLVGILASMAFILHFFFPSPFGQWNRWSLPRRGEKDFGLRNCKFFVPSENFSRFARLRTRKLPSVREPSSGKLSAFFMA